MWGGGGGGVGIDYLDRPSLICVASRPLSGSARRTARPSRAGSPKAARAGSAAKPGLGPVARTENYVDGRLNDTQVTAPWSCEWDTRHFVNGGHLLTVKAYDAANNLFGEDTIRVTVNNPNPPPVNNPPPPTVESPSGVWRPPRVAPPNGSQPGATPKPRFTGLMARRAVKRALARRYGKAFRLRKGYTTTCLKTNPSRWSCTARWRYGEFIYKGKIKLRLRSDGRIASRVVLRKTFSKAPRH